MSLPLASAANGQQYAARHLTALEKAFTNALQTVLTEQPEKPLARAAEILAAFAVEHETVATPVPVVEATDEAAVTTPRSLARQESAASAMAMLHGGAHPSAKAEDAHAHAHAHAAHTHAAARSGPRLRPESISKLVAVQSTVESNSTSSFEDNASASSRAKPERRAPEPPVGSSKDRHAEAEAIMQELRTAFQRSPTVDSLTHGRMSLISFLEAEFARLDKQGHGTVTLHDFKRVVVHSKAFTDEAKLAKLHHHFDKTGLGEVVIFDFLRTITSNRQLSRRASTSLSRR
jgi:hypothetical protein